MSAQDDFTTLNPGAGGDTMDETGLNFGSAPTRRKRPRVVITGDGGVDEIVPVKNTQPNNADYGLVTRQVPGPVHPGTELTQFGEVTLVSSSTELTVATYTVPGGQTLRFTGFIASGDGYGKFIVYVAGAQRFVLRSSAQNLNVALNIEPITIAVTAGQTISVRIIHEVQGFVGNFQATLMGYLI